MRIESTSRFFIGHYRVIVRVKQLSLKETYDDTAIRDAVREVNEWMSAGNEVTVPGIVRHLLRVSDVVSVEVFVNDRQSVEVFVTDHRQPVFFSEE